MTCSDHAYDADDFRAQFDVSRETIARLGAYAATLRKWQPRINLIGGGTIDSIWQRHFADSAQIVRHLRSDARRLVDLGSGAGFPGLVVKVLRPDIHVTLVEADQRKVAFLRAAAIASGVRVDVVPRRIESLAVDPLRPAADVVSARALAPLPALLALAAGWIDDEPQFLFLKGKDFERELISAAKYWTMNVRKIQSIVQTDARLLSIESLARVDT